MTKRFTASLLIGFMYVFSAQAVVLLSGVIKALVVPVLVGVSDYGYWQIYVFYCTYLGLFSLGYCDGIYLKYGGRKLDKLPIINIRPANGVYLGLLFVGAIALALWASVFSDPSRKLVYYSLALNVVLVGVVHNISLVLQATNRLKEYAVANSVDKIFFLLAMFAMFSVEFRRFEFLIAADVVSKCLVLALLIKQYHHLFYGQWSSLTNGLNEFRENIQVGCKLLVANLSGMLVLGVGRLIVEYFDTLDAYAHYALAVSLTNIVLVCVTALSIAFYPSLKQLPTARYKDLFNKANSAYSGISILFLAGYFPAVLFVDLMASEYQPVIGFLNAMFVITVLQGKMQLIINTYYKALRLEGKMLVANLTSLAIATFLSAASYFLTGSILAIAYSTLLTMFFRVYSSEVFLRQHMGDKPNKSILYEICLVAAFLLITSILSVTSAALIWLVIIAFVAIVNRETLAQLWLRFREAPR